MIVKYRLSFSSLFLFIISAHSLFLSLLLSFCISLPFVNSFSFSFYHTVSNFLFSTFSLFDNSNRSLSYTDIPCNKFLWNILIVRFIKFKFLTMWGRFYSLREDFALSIRRLNPFKQASRINTDFIIIFTLPFNFVVTKIKQFALSSPVWIRNVGGMQSDLSAWPSSTLMMSAKLKWSLFNSPADL